jgi:hypothetical protein
MIDLSLESKCAQRVELFLGSDQIEQLLEMARGSQRLELWVSAEQFKQMNDESSVGDHQGSQRVQVWLGPEQMDNRAIRATEASLPNLRNQSSPLEASRGNWSSVGRADTVGGYRAGVRADKQQNQSWEDVEDTSSFSDNIVCSIRGKNSSGLIGARSNSTSGRSAIAETQLPLICESSVGPTLVNRQMVQLETPQCQSIEGLKNSTGRMLSARSFLNGITSIAEQQSVAPISVRPKRAMQLHVEDGLELQHRQGSSARCISSSRYNNHDMHDMHAMHDLPFSPTISQRRQSDLSSGAPPGRGSTEPIIRQNSITNIIDTSLDDGSQLPSIRLLNRRADFTVSPHSSGYTEVIGMDGADDTSSFERAVKMFQQPSRGSTGSTACIVDQRTSFATSDA